MKILHLCLSCFYIDGYAYQENELVAQNVRDGHDVLVVASTETFGADRKLSYVEPSEYMGGEGARVIRLPYRKFLPHFLMKKIRSHPGLFSILVKEKPDVVFFHGLCGWELLTVKKYKKLNPRVRFLADSHEDWHNSGRGLLSRWVLHEFFYKKIISKSLSAIDKIFAVSVEVGQFIEKRYGVPKKTVTFLPLGGVVFSDEEYSSRRVKTREKFGVENEDVLFVQSGKFDKAKKLKDALISFSAIKNIKWKFFVVGALLDDVKDEVESLIKMDSRIVFLGWKGGEELRDILCAADVYVQPGSQSATMQMSVCCRCAVILDDVESHRALIDGNGFLVGRSKSLQKAFEDLNSGEFDLIVMAEKSNQVACNLLDYKEQAKLIYN